MAKNRTSLARECVATLLALSVFMITQGCTDPEEPLKDLPPALLDSIDRAQLPYKQGDSIKMHYSAGDTFWLSVDTLYEITKTTRASRDQPSLIAPSQPTELRKAHLHSRDPELSIIITIAPRNATQYSSSIQINSSLFHWYSGDTVTAHTIGSTTYPVLRHFTLEQTTQNSRITVSELYYSPSHGIVQIGKSNGETFTRSNYCFAGQI